MVHTSGNEEINHLRATAVCAGLRNRSEEREKVVNQDASFQIVFSPLIHQQKDSCVGVKVYFLRIIFHCIIVLSGADAIESKVRELNTFVPSFDPSEYLISEDMGSKKRRKLNVVASPKKSREKRRGTCSKSRPFRHKRQPCVSCQ